MSFGYFLSHIHCSSVSPITRGVPPRAARFSISRALARSPISSEHSERSTGAPDLNPSLCSLPRMSFGYFRLPSICPALRGPRNNRSSECEIRKRSWRFGVHFAIPIARNPRLYTLHFPLYTRKIAPISDFICINAKKSVSLRAK